MKNKKIKYNVGDILEVETFAGPKIHKKVSNIIDRKTEWKDGSVTHLKGFDGTFVRRKDLYSLRNNCVPYTGKEVLKKTVSFTFDWQIIKVIKRGNKP
tara:strand:- start:648 stop:941 length:294 start_codon:yes stop_codon:yes gene_type:complete